MDLDAIPGSYEGVVAAACRVQDQIVSPGAIRFQTDGIANSHAVICVAMPAAPKSVALGGKALPSDAFEFGDGLLRLRFTNTAKSQEIEIAR